MGVRLSQKLSCSDDACRSMRCGHTRSHPAEKGHSCSNIIKCCNICRPGIRKGKARKQCGTCFPLNDQSLKTDKLLSRRVDIPMKFISNLIFHHRSCSNIVLCAVCVWRQQSMIVERDFHTVNHGKFIEITDIFIESNEYWSILIALQNRFAWLFIYSSDFWILLRYNLWLDILCILFLLLLFFGGVNWMDIHSSFYALRWAFVMNKLWPMNSSNAKSIRPTQFQS